MRFMFVTTSQFPVPPVQIPAMMDGFAAWWERYRDRFEAAGFFAEGGGGGGICNVADEAEFHQMIMEWPFAQYSDNRAYALVDMDTALGQWKAMLASMQGDT